MRSRAALLLGMVMTLAQPVQALTLEDIIALTLSGYEDEAILRLIEETGSVFHITAQDLVELHEAGVSEKVMQAMIRSGASRESQVTTEASQGREEKEQDEHGSSPERAEPRHAEPELLGRLLGRPLEWSTYSFHEDAHAGAHERGREGEGARSEGRRGAARQPEVHD